MREIKVLDWYATLSTSLLLFILFSKLVDQFVFESESRLIYPGYKRFFSRKWRPKAEKPLAPRVRLIVQVTFRPKYLKELTAQEN